MLSIPQQESRKSLEIQQRAEAWNQRLEKAQMVAILQARTHRSEVGRKEAEDELHTLRRYVDSELRKVFVDKAALSLAREFARIFADHIANVMPDHRFAEWTKKLLEEFLYRDGGAALPEEVHRSLRDIFDWAVVQVRPARRPPDHRFELDETVMIETMVVWPPRRRDTSLHFTFPIAGR